MIPIIWFLIVWLIAMGVFFLLAILTMGIALRFGLSGSKTFILCILFFVVSVVVAGGVGLYELTHVDWTQTVNPLPTGSTSNNYLMPTNPL